jgi:hypothetical protein
MTPFEIIALIMLFFIALGVGKIAQVLDEAYDELNRRFRK